MSEGVRRLFNKKRGWLLIALLVGATIIIMFWTMQINTQRRQIKRNVKQELVQSLIYECKWNHSRIEQYLALTKVSKKYGTGKQKYNKVYLQTL